MCMVSINIDEAALREMRPELDSTAAIRPLGTGAC